MTTHLENFFFPQEQLCVFIDLTLHFVKVSLAEEIKKRTEVITTYLAHFLTEGEIKIFEEKKKRPYLICVHLLCDTRMLNLRTI